ncbi:hypothetical protein [Arcticibacter tournemirensis]
MPNHQLPNQLYSSNTLYTLSGAATAVWIICLVLSTVIPPHILTVYHWRLIALTLSEFFAILIIFQKRDRKIDIWVIGIINGLLIFINASGINAVTTGIAFENQTHSQKKAGIADNKHLSLSGILFLDRQINWWPDRELIHKNYSLNNDNHKLRDDNNILRNRIKKLENEAPMEKVENSSAIGEHSEEISLLRQQLSSLQKSLKILNDNNAELQKSKTPSQVPISQKTNSTVDLVLVKDELKACQNENDLLRSQIKKIRNYERLLREAEKYGL